MWKESWVTEHACWPQWPDKCPISVVWRVPYPLSAWTLPTVRMSLQGLRESYQERHPNLWLGGVSPMDKGSFGGAILAIAGIVAGLLIEGGNLGQVLQPTAALIVFGGTLGAVLLQFPLATVVGAFRSLTHAFAAPSKHDAHLIQLLVAFANKARRNGVVSLD